jgi:HAD superfamily hydrolase (TIGR01509 family)
VFDLDGVVVDSEQVWDVVREQLTRDWGGRYDAAAQRAMMGMSSTEWSRYMHDELGLAQSPQEINDEVVRRMLATYEKELPLLPGAVEAIGRLRDAGLVLAVASSSNRALIDAVLRAAGVTELFATTVSSEEVARGKPSPDVYLEAARRLDVSPENCAAVEDSHSGIRSAHAAGMRVIAIPNASYPPDAEALELADVVLDSLDQLTPSRIEGT